MTARTLSPFHGPNRTGELQLSFQEAIVRRDLTVSRIEDITPRYRRIVLTGEDLEAGYPFRRFAPLDHVKAYFPDAESGEIVAYRQTAEGGWEVDSDTGHPIRRDYTPRAWDPQARELSLDFVLHDHGVAGRWAQGARVGEALTLMGPRANWLLPEDYPRYLAAGDETALPALARLIEEAPAGAQVTALIEVADAQEEQPLTPAPGVTLDLRWIHRDTAHVGEGDVSAVETAMRALTLPGDLDGLFVVVAGEATAMKPIRRYLRRELGLPKHQVHVDGYWKRGVADHDHHTTDEDED